MKNPIKLSTKQISMTSQPASDDAVKSGESTTQDTASGVGQTDGSSVDNPSLQPDPNQSTDATQADITNVSDQSSQGPTKALTNSDAAVQETPPVTEHANTKTEQPKPTEDQPNTMPTQQDNGPVAQTSEQPTDTIVLPDVLLADTDPQLIKLLEKFSTSVSWDVRAWARSVLSESAKYERSLPQTEEGFAKCTRHFLGVMEQSISFEENIQQRMRFILILTKFLPNVFGLDLMARGADKLTDQQVIRYNTLATFYHYWATLNSTSEIGSRFNVSKEFTAAYNAETAARVMAVM